MGFFGERAREAEATAGAKHMSRLEAYRILLANPKPTGAELAQAIALGLQLGFDADQIEHHEGVMARHRELGEAIANGAIDEARARHADAPRALSELRREHERIKAEMRERERAEDRRVEMLGNAAKILARQGSDRRQLERDNAALFGLPEPPVAQTPDVVESPEIVFTTVETEAEPPKVIHMPMPGPELTIVE